MDNPTIRVDRTPPALTRWVAGILCIVFGFAKINGSQFTVLDSELTRPMGEVSGFWLTWYYFGYSSVYGHGLAVLQILSGILVALPRTALAGALLLLPIAVNIVLIDVFYGVDLPGTMAAIVLLVCVLAIVGPHTRRLVDTVLLQTAPRRPTARSVGALIVVLAGAFGFTWWVANYNNRAPTSIDGVWVVSSQTPESPGGRRWRQVFFEYNRAHLAVFRGDRGQDERRHFEIDSDGVIRVWEAWLTKGALIMSGRRLSEIEIELDIRAEPAGEPLILRRVRPAR